MGKVTRREFINDTLLAAAAAMGAPSAALAAAPQEARNTSPNETIRVAVMGVRGRGRSHIQSCKDLPNVEVVTLCDADSAVIGPAQQMVPKAKYEQDIRRVLDDKSIDVISAATLVSWHSLATIWALQAGKHVYVEKPMTHNVVEGRRVVEAAAKYRKVVQHGTQGRSHEATRQAIQWLHAGGLGKVHLAYGTCYKRRPSIGHAEPSDPPPTVDYDLWVGPAEKRPFRTTNFHYNWHWVFNTGTGDIAAQGVHQMDIARWGLGMDRFPDKVMSVGGRLGYVDDGNTANTQVAVYDYGDRHLIFEVRGLPTPKYMDKTGVGVVFHGEKGYLVSESYGRLPVFAPDAKTVIREFHGGGDNYKVFIDAIRANKPESVTGLPIDAHISSALCHLGNTSFRMGEERALGSTEEPFGREYRDANVAFQRMRRHLNDNGVDSSTKYNIGPLLQFDHKTERYVGARADEANRYLTRDYRKGFVVPDKV